MAVAIAPVMKIPLANHNRPLRLFSANTAITPQKLPWRVTLPTHACQKPAVLVRSSVS
jgi:hypothetical protein